MTDALKPCPFCGDKPTLHVSHRGDDLAALACENDQCSIGPATDYLPDAQLAAAWNRRAPEPSPATALREREPVAWRHAANEWADMATSGIQWLRNIRDGISTVDDALSNMDDCLKHCEATSRVAAPAPTPEHQEEQS